LGGREQTALGRLQKVMLRCEAIVNCMLHIARVLICLRQQLALVLQEAYIESELQPFIE